MLETQTTTDLIRLSQAAKLYPKAIHSSGVWRHCRRGVKAANGSRVRLRHVRAGGYIYTRREWMEQFFEAVAAADLEHFIDTGDDHRPAPKLRMPDQRAKAVAEARAELRA